MGVTTGFILGDSVQFGVVCVDLQQGDSDLVALEFGPVCVDARRICRSSLRHRMGSRMLPNVVLLGIGMDCWHAYEVLEGLMCAWRGR